MTRTAVATPFPECDDRGYIGPAVCHHDPDAGPRATRWVQQTREAIDG